VNKRMTSMEKMKLHSPDLSQDNITKIRDLFPGCVTEATDENGKLRLAVDFDRLRQELSDHIVEGGQERYRLDWPGKREAMAMANIPIAKTLRPAHDESVDFDTTQNLFIEGDNLEALKLLQTAYLGGIKMIYIDPPYNTGNDFIYNDDFKQNTADYLRESSQISNDGERLIANTTSNGRFHSDWLSMMYARLKLARNLLSDDGILFISISDVEQANLRKICEDIFGFDNVIAQITWKARVKPVNIGEAKYRPQREIEYVLVVQKTQTSGSFYPLLTGGERSYPHEEKGRKYRLTTILKSNRGANHRSTMSFSLGDYTPPEGQRWQAGEEVIKQLHSDGYIEFRDGVPFKRYYEDEEGAEHDPFYCFMDGDLSSTSEAGKNHLNEILGSNHSFDTVKPVQLLRTLIQSCTSPGEDHIILDFFAGSGTTAEALIGLNAEDGGRRRFVLVQIAEENGLKGSKSDFDLVSEITKERIRRAGKRIHKSEFSPEWNKDVGFRVLKIDTSNMEDVYYRPDEVKQADLLTAVDNVKPDRTAEDLLFQVLVDWGVDLTLPIRRETVQGKTVGGFKLQVQRLI
jgi:adenine-specific DNA-methyltransferase